MVVGTNNNNSTIATTTNQTVYDHYYPTAVPTTAAFNDCNSTVLDFYTNSTSAVNDINNTNMNSSMTTNTTGTTMSTTSTDDRFMMSDTFKVFGTITLLLFIVAFFVKYAMFDRQRNAHNGQQRPTLILPPTVVNQTKVKLSDDDRYTLIESSMTNVLVLEHNPKLTTFVVDCPIAVVSKNETNTTSDEDDEEMNEVCCICLDTFQVGNVVSFSNSTINENDVELGARGTCEHIFHHSCIHEWLKRNDSCPSCRFEMIQLQQKDVVTTTNDDANSISDKALGKVDDTNSISDKIFGKVDSKMYYCIQHGVVHTI